MTTSVTPGATGAVRSPSPSAARLSGAGARATWRSLGIALLALLVVAQCLYLYGSIASKASLDVYARGIDLTATLVGSRVIRDGDGARLYDLDTQRAALARVLAPDLTYGGGADLPYIHPPFEALIVAPLLALPPGTLYLLWSGLILLATAAALLLLARTLPLGSGITAIVVVAVCAYGGLHQALLLGQSSPLVLLGLCGAYAGLHRRRDGWVGVALALMILKPQLLIVVGLALVVQRRWRALAVCAASIAGAGIAAMTVLGPLWPLRYARFLLGVSGWGPEHNVYPSIMQNWRGLGYHLVGGDPAGPAAAAIGALTAASVGLLLWVWRRAAARAGHDEPGAEALAWGCTCLVAILAAPHLYLHDLTILIFPAWIAVWWLRATGWPRPATQLWLAIIWGSFLLALVYPFRSERFLFFPTVPGTLLLVAAAGLFALQALRPATGRESSSGQPAPPGPPHAA